MAFSSMRAPRPLRQKRSLILVSSATALALVMTTANSVHANSEALTTAAPGGIRPADFAILRAQAPLIETATAIQELAQRKGLDGFTGTSIDDGRLTVYWHGELPQEIESVLSESAESKGFAVETVKAPYSLATLDAEAYRLASLPGVNSAGALEDFSGLWVGVDPSTLDAVAKSASDPSSLVPESSVKVIARPVGEMEPAARWDDTSPFEGGSAIEHRSGFWPFYSYTRCSSGFGARRNSDNAEVMITARHCGTNWEWHIAEGSEQSLGTSSGGVARQDAMYIHGGNYQPRVFTGPSTSSTTIAINGYVYPSMNALICYSGAPSGATCDNYITATTVYIDLEGFGTTGPGFWTETTNHSLAGAGKGDSGGPALAGSSGSGLNGAGIITALDRNTLTTCRGRGDRDCAWRIFAVNLVASLVQQQLTLQTAAS